MSITSLLFTARDALASNQMAIDITGGNIANVNTPGYSRQRVELRSVGGINVGGANADIGVSVSRVERIYDRFTDSQIIDQQKNTGYSDTLLQGLQNIEMKIDDIQGGGISEQLNKFWTSWESLSNNPSGIVERNSLISDAKNLTEGIASYKLNLDSIKTDLGVSIKDTLDVINEKVASIRDWNAKIIAISGDNGEKNDLLDKRMQALKELGALLNIQTVENANGAISVYLSNGEPLLQGIQATTLRVATNSDGQSDIYLSGLSGETVNSALTSGKLGALVKLQSSIIPEYIGYIEDFTQTLADQVNELHRNGFDIYNNTGVDFFEAPDAVSQVLGGDEKLYTTAARTTAISENTTWDKIYNDNGASAGLVNGDKISFTGTSRTGAAVSGSFTITNAAGQTVQDLLNSIETAFGGQVTAAINNSGQITITDNFSGSSKLALTFDYSDAGSLDFGTVSTTNSSGQGGHYNWDTIAGTIRVNTAITADANRIAASASVSGDGENASLIAAIRDMQLLINGRSSSLGSFLASTVGQIGQQVVTAKSGSDRQTAIANLLSNQKESISGVSIDEEMIRLLNYQMGYNAAGKLAKTVNEMMDTLMGLVQ